LVGKLSWYQFGSNWERLGTTRDTIRSCWTNLLGPLKSQIGIALEYGKPLAALLAAWQSKACS
jgi:hypothetical protein